MFRWLNAIAISFCLAGCGDGISKLPDPPEVSGVSPENTYSRVCAVCHGESGEGKRELRAPSIAGMPSWYVREQLEKYRNGFRGTDPENVEEGLMKTISLSLSDEQLAAAANEIEGLQPIPTAITSEGDVERGRVLFAESCMSCHRFTGLGERAFHSGPLVTLNPEYLKRQLENYAGGKRGGKVEDYYGQKMHLASTRLTPRDITDLVRYIGELARGDDPRLVMEK